MKTKLLKHNTLFIGLLLLNGCVQDQEFTLMNLDDLQDKISIEPDSSDVPEYIGYNTVTDSYSIPGVENASCDPLTGNENSSLGANNKGITGNIRLLNEKGLSNCGARKNLYSYLDEEISYKLSDFIIFMGNINVPERPFDEGFESIDRSIIEINGERLVEWFNVNLDSKMSVSSDELAGEYELAILSDDGSILTLTNEDGQEVKYIDSPQVHAPKFLCGDDEGKQHFIDFSKGKTYKMKLNYFQGPRWHIALQMYWRKKTPDHKKKSSLCGQTIWKQNINRVTDDGWQIVPPEVFNMPENGLNICANERDHLNELYLSNKPETDGFSIKIKVNGIDFPTDYSIIEEIDESNNVKYKIKLENPILLVQDVKVEIIYFTFIE